MKAKPSLQNLRKQVLEAKLELVRQHLVLYTFGSASGISRGHGLVVIKPSGVRCEELKPGHMVGTDLGGKVVEGNLRPSSDLPTHLVLYKHFPASGGVAHTHSEYATAWAQAGKSIPCFGTTHADYFHGPIPVASEMSDSEITQDYEKNAGHAIVRCLRNTDALSIPGVLVANHGPFGWGEGPRAAAHHAVILESIARMAHFTLGIHRDSLSLKRALHDKHYLRKHGKHAYYGQAETKTLHHGQRSA